MAAWHLLKGADPGGGSKSGGPDFGLGLEETDLSPQGLGPGFLLLNPAPWVPLAQPAHPGEGLPHLPTPLDDSPALQKRIFFFPDQISKKVKGLQSVQKKETATLPSSQT